MEPKPENYRQESFHELFTVYKRHDTCDTDGCCKWTSDYPYPYQSIRLPKYIHTRISSRYSNVDCAKKPCIRNSSIYHRDTVEPFSGL